MRVDTFSISGLKLVTLKSFPDARGFFCERFKESAFREAGLPTLYVQDNFSRSATKVLRGLHFQWDQPQGKLVTCLSGAILDVAVDLRASSSTFGKVTAIELSGAKPQWFWVPAGFAHGFCVIGNQEADVFYKCDNEYNGKGEGGICYNDPDLQIQWPIRDIIVSEKDQQMLSFQDYKKMPRFQ